MIILAGAQNFLKTPSSFISMFYDVHRSVHVVRIQRCLTKTVSSVSFFLIRVKAVSIWAPSKIIIFEYFRWGPKLYRVTIFFGSHVPNFLEALSSLVLLFSDLQGRLHVVRMRKMPHQNLSSIAFFSTSHQLCVDLSPMENYNFRWGPNFIESPSSLVHMFQTF